MFLHNYWWWYITNHFTGIRSDIMGIYWDASMNHTYIYIYMYIYTWSLHWCRDLYQQRWVDNKDSIYIYNYINDNSNNNDYWVAQPMELLPKTGWWFSPCFFHPYLQPAAVTPDDSDLSEGRPNHCVLCLGSFSSDRIGIRRNMRTFGLLQMFH